MHPGLRTVSILTLPDGVVFKDTAQTKLYRDTQSTRWRIGRSIAGPAIYSHLYDPNVRGKQVPLSKEYRQATATRNFGNDGKARPPYWKNTGILSLIRQLASLGHIHHWFQCHVYMAWCLAHLCILDGAVRVTESFPDFVTGNKTWPAHVCRERCALDLLARGGEWPSTQFRRARISGRVP